MIRIFKEDRSELYRIINKFTKHDKKKEPEWASLVLKVKEWGGSPTYLPNII
jgi:superfamily I DNA and RNA helicase